MTSRRVPGAAPPNAWSLALDARRRAGAPLVDLTDQNPTRAGLTDPGAAAWGALADPGGVRYEPDPRGLASARVAVAATYAQRGLAVDPGDLVLTASTSEAYAHLFRMLCDPGDTVLVPAPGYPLFEPLARLESVRLGLLPLREEGRWRIDFDALDATLGPRVRAIVLVQPNHPTGSCLAREELAALEHRCAARGIALIADEVFGEFLWREAGRPPGPEPSLLAGECLAPTFVLQGLSKLCGLPQLKLSWIALAGPEAPRAEARAALEWIGDAFLSVGTPVQLALPALLATRHAFRDRVLARVLGNREALARALAATPARLTPADGGWTAMIRLPDGTDGEHLSLALLERDVVTHPSHFYDEPDDAYLVVSLIGEPTSFASAAKRIAEVIA
jgi:alanine-synthesizing transaminase